MALTAHRIELGKRGLGASEVAAAVGLNPFKSPVTLAAEKLGLVEPFAGNEATDIGTALEPVIAGLFAKRQRIADFDLLPSDPIPHPTAPHIFATPDRKWVVGKLQFEPVEIKAAGARSAWRWGDEGDAVPEEYLVQVQVQMACMQAPRGHLVALVGGSDLRVYTIPADPELQGELVDAAERFWTDYVAKGVLPPMDGSESTTEYLRKRFPKDTRPMLPATAEAEAILHRLAEAREARVQAETLEAEAANELKALIGDAAGIEGIATWKASAPRKVIGWERVAKTYADQILKLHPEMAPLVDATAEAFTETKPGTRRFLPRLPKEK